MTMPEPDDGFTQARDLAVRLLDRTIFEHDIQTIAAALEMAYRRGWADHAEASAAEGGMSSRSCC
jgi:hypothetical protein